MPRFQSRHFQYEIRNQNPVSKQSTIDRKPENTDYLSSAGESSDNSIT